MFVFYYYFYQKFVVNKEIKKKQKKKKKIQKFSEREHPQQGLAELKWMTHFSLSILQDGVFAIPVVTFVFGVCMYVSSSRCLLVVHDS